MLPTLLAGALWVAPTPATAKAAGGSWTPAGRLGVPRPGGAATVLPDGRVLVAGGGNPSEASAEVFDPLTGAWTPTAAMSGARTDHAAVRLNDGRVLVSGGRIGPDALSSAEVFDAATGTWTGVASMALARQSHTATLLTDGKVLVAGGLGGGHGPHRSETELFDPATGTWTTTEPMPQPRAHHTATLLGNGRVLVVGGEGAPHGDSLRDAAVYDPGTGSWSPVPRLLETGRADHTATALPDGTVLVAGGTTVHVGGRPENMLASTESLDRDAQAFLPSPALRQRRSYHAASLLADGRLLVAGGIGERTAEPLASAELYDPASHRWTDAAPVPEPSAGSAAVLLAGSACGPACGKVLVVGPQAAFLFDPPSPGDAGSASTTGALVGAVALGGAVFIAVVGGAAVFRRRRATPSRRKTHETLERR